MTGDWLWFGWLVQSRSAHKDCTKERLRACCMLAWLPIRASAGLAIWAVLELGVK